MIAMLRGVLEEKRPDHIVLDVGGVGYRVFIALSTYETLPDRGQTVRLLTLTHVREDALHLYGFFTQEEKALFVLLNTVNGISAKLALSALSSMSVRALASAIAAEEIAALCRIPGIGRKIAQRLVVELKERLPAEWLVGTPTPSAQQTTPASPAPATPAHAGVAGAQVKEEIGSALLNLGYKRSDVAWALEQVGKTHTPDEGAPALSITFGDGFRAALNLLSRHVIAP